MKNNNILMFILGALMMICISSTTEPPIVHTIPATPKSVIVKDFTNHTTLQQDTHDFILKKVKEGYMVKSVTVWNGDTWSHAIIVMEKY